MARLSPIAEQLGLELRDSRLPYDRFPRYALSFPGARDDLYTCYSLDDVEAFLANEPGNVELYAAEYGGLEDTAARWRKARLAAWQKIEKRRSRSRK